MTTEKRRPTILLDDSPASSDAFGSHQRVADAVTEVVQTEAGGRSIGLEGGWGSGKSTVVQLVAEKLSKIGDPKFQVAMFDMWAHQGDPLRRTFLEKLIEQLRSCEWVNDEYWEIQQHELAGRRREDTTSVVPRLTVAGGWFALTLLVIPVGAALISAALALWTAEKPPSDLVIKSLLVLGAVLAFLPAIYYGAWRCIQKKKGEDGLNDLPALIMGQASTESRTIVTETPDPTSVEFETIFGDLLNEALNDQPHKLLIVVDNLDRVQPSDALSIWSTLQTFLGHSDYSNADWIDKLWILIPYDKSAILRLWDGSKQEDGNSSVSLLATSFLDKTFQIRFRVPQLLLSNWRGFLQDNLRSAFPNHEEDDFHGVYRAFAAKGGLETSAPTPRDLKIFVNQIGALHRKWHDTFTLAHYACYSLLQKDNERVHKILLDNDDRGFLNRIIGNDWRETMAALHFGVPVEEANQLLLRSPIEAALSEGDGEALTELASVHPVGFWSVLEHAAPFGAEDWSGLRPAELARCATALAKCGVFLDADGMQEATSVRSGIRDAVLAFDDWEPFDVATANGMVAVARLVDNKDEIVASLLSGATNSFSEDEVVATVWVSSVFTLLQGLKGLTGLGLDDQLRQGFGVPLQSQHWLDLAPEITAKDPEYQYLQHFELHAAADIDAHLAETIENRLLDEDVFDAVRAAMATRSANAMQATAKVVFSDFVSGVSMSGDQHGLMLKVLRLSQQVGLITQTQLAQNDGNSHYLDHFHSAFSEGHAASVAEAMYGYLSLDPDANEPPYFGNSSFGYQSLEQLLNSPDDVPGAVDRFTDLAKETYQLAAVFEMAAARRTVVPFFLKVLSELIDYHDGMIAEDLVQKYWSIIHAVLEHNDSRSFTTFLEKLPEYSKLVDNLMKHEFDQEDIGLYLAILKRHNDDDFAAWCVAGLSTVEMDEWWIAIESHNDLLKLVVGINTDAVELNLGVAFSGALAKYAEHVAVEADAFLPSETWRQLFGLLNSHQQEMFARRAYRNLVETEGDASTEFFEIFGSIVSNPNVIVNEDRFIYQVCIPMLNSENLSGISWIADIADSNPELLVEHDDPAALDEFADGIRRTIIQMSEDDPKFHDLKRIGNALSIEIDALKTDSTEADTPPTM